MTEDRVQLIKSIWSQIADKLKKTTKSKYSHKCEISKKHNYCVRFYDTLYLFYIFPQLSIIMFYRKRKPKFSKGFSEFFFLLISINKF